MKSKIDTLLKQVSYSDESGSIVKKLETISSGFRTTPTIIARDLKIEGIINGSGIVEIEGNVNGKINGNSVIIREEGIIEGEIVAESLHIKGTFNGTIRAKNISLYSRSRVSGNIEYVVLSVEDGACVDGQFKKISEI